MSQDKTVNFLLGLGAQKTGSTWLWHFLRDHPETNMGDLKEYGVWDTVLLPERSMRQENYAKRLSALDSRDPERKSGVSRPGDLNRRAGLASAREMMANPSLYPKHFMDLARSHPGVRLVGDITPGYARLGTEHLHTVKSVLETAGFDVKPVFILRDPVTRMTSAYQMFLRRQAHRASVSKASAISLLDFSEKVGNAARADYPHTLKALHHVIGDDNVFFGQYETFFDQTEVGRLLSFLGVTWLEPDINHRINRAGSATAPRARDLVDLRKRLEPIYEFCYRRFPTWDFDKWTSV